MTQTLISAFARRAAASVLAFSLLAPASVAAQDTASTLSVASASAADYRNRLLGVFDEETGLPLENVDVIDLLTGTRAATTQTGTVSLAFLPDGGAVVRVQKLGYALQTFFVPISPADTTPLTVTLGHVVQLPGMTTTEARTGYRTPALRGFEARMEMGVGHFISSEDLRKHDGSPIDQLIRTHMPGVIFNNGAGGAQFLVSQRNCGSLGGGRAGCQAPRCYVNVYLDGIRIYNGRDGIRPDFGRIYTTDFAGVEYYQDGATVPAQYGGTDADCGVLLLWSRIE